MTAVAAGGWRPWLARGALVATGLTLVSLLAPAVPRSQEIRLMLDGESAGMDRTVHLEISPPGGPPERGARILVPAGKTEISHTTELRPGEYVLDIRVVRSTITGDVTSATVLDHVVLKGEPTTLYLNGRK
jgi:hypothetical protein